MTLMDDLLICLVTLCGETKICGLQAVMRAALGARATQTRFPVWAANACMLERTRTEGDQTSLDLAMDQ